MIKILQYQEIPLLIRDSVPKHPSRRLVILRFHSLGIRTKLIASLIMNDFERQELIVTIQVGYGLHALGSISRSVDISPPSPFEAMDVQALLRKERSHCRENLLLT